MMLMQKIPQRGLMQKELLEILPIQQMLQNQNYLDHL
jgi:hypothetical protein